MQEAGIGLIEFAYDTQITVAGAVRAFHQTSHLSQTRLKSQERHHNARRTLCKCAPGVNRKTERLINDQKIAAPGVERISGYGEQFGLILSK